MPSDEQKQRIKRMLVDQLQMRMKPEDIGDTQQLFGDDGLGLDSVDAIEVVAGIEQEFGHAFTDEAQARDVLVSVQTLAVFLEEQGKL